MVGVALPTSGPAGPIFHPVKTPFFLYYVTMMAVIGGLLFGYDCGVVAGAMVILRDEWKSVNDFWQESIISMTVLFAAIFALVGGFLNDRFGRRIVILLSSVLFVGGAIFLAISQTKAMLLVGRAIVGSAIGMSSMTVPAYIAEVSPPHIRGRMIVLFQLFMTLGFWLAGLLDAAFSYLNHGIAWRLMFGVAAVPAIVQFVGFLFLPESPRWLATNGRDKEAERVLNRLCGSEEFARHELKLIMLSHEEAEREKAAKGGKYPLITMLKTPPLRRALIVGCSMQMFQQLCGINTVMYYSTSIVKMGGVRSVSMAEWLTAVTSGFNFVCTFLGIYLVDKIGRRKLLLWSVAGVILCLLLLGIGFVLIAKESPNGLDVSSEATRNRYGIDGNQACKGITDSCDKCSYEENCGYCFLKSNHSLGFCLKARNDSSEYSNVWNCTENPENSKNSEYPDFIFANGWCPTKLAFFPIVAMVLYLVAFSSGFGPMPWTLNAEIYPMWARSTGNAMATATNWTFNLIISLTFLTLSSAITRQGAFFLYAGITIIGWVVFYFIVPETRDKELEELEHLFDQPFFGKKSQFRPEKKMTTIGPFANEFDESSSKINGTFKENYSDMKF